ncbi:MAG: lytic transglycosylase domain-containing protein [Jatrophihabitans sp.]
MMLPAEPPRRPRPGPRLPAVPAAESGSSAGTDHVAPQLPAGRAGGTVVVDGEIIRMPGLAALLRRNPKLGRGGAIGAIVSGVALFVIASLTTPIASADEAKPPSPSSSPADTTSLPLPGMSIDPAAPVVMRLLQTKPTHAKKQAPVSHGVISGLAGNGIPQVALNAYRVAAARIGNVSPGCGIDWALLAGIGREESDHGRFGGAVLHADGVSTPAIIGPALDGAHWDYIPAPANGMALDGDAKYAHALGPMQFIPSTWGVFGTDATGDGKADIFNINDAALGAARYLCAAGGDLRSHAGQVRAVLAYNHSDEYLAQVLALADAYRRGVSITGIPTGITKGALPKVNTGYIPPANPGAPTAVGGSGSDKTKSTTTPKSTASSTPRQTTTTAAKPGGTSAASTGSTRTSSSASPTKATTPPTSTPTPAPTKTCNPIEVLLGCKP